MRTSPTSPAPHSPSPRPRADGRASSASAPRYSSSSTPSPARPLTSATNGWTSSPPTRSAARCSRRCSTARSGRTRPASCSWTHALDFYLDWDRIAHDVVALLRSAAGRNPYDRDLTDLVGELSTRSDEFRQHWARHDVRFHISGVKRYHHRDVGDLELNYERLNLAFDAGLTVITYTADRGTRSAEALALLGTLAATAAAENPTSAP